MVFGEIFDAFGANLALANVAYTYEIVPRFRIGAGAGIGTANVDNLVDGRMSKVAYAAFARFKYNFWGKPSSMFCQLDGGYNWADFTNPWNSKKIDLGPFFTPSIGYDFSIGKGQKISLTTGFQIQSTRYNETYIYSSNYYYGIPASEIEDWYVGVKLAVGYSF